MSKKDQAPAVSGNEGKPTKLHVKPPRLPSLQKHVRGLPMPIRVNVRNGMNAPTDDTDEKPSRKRHRTR